MQGGSKSLPSTPGDHDSIQRTGPMWSTGPQKEISEKFIRPPGARVKLFAEEEKSKQSDLNLEKSVHSSANSCVITNEDAEFGSSPVTYWNVQDGTVKKSQFENIKYFSRDDFDTRLNTTTVTGGSNIEGRLSDYIHQQSKGKDSQGCSPPHPVNVTSQSNIQDRLFRNEHFTSSPLKSVQSEDIQDFSLVSSISAPFELRPKPYNDTILSEHSTLNEDSVDRDLQEQGASQNQSKTAILLGRTQGQSSSLSALNILQSDANSLSEMPSSKNLVASRNDRSEPVVGQIDHRLNQKAMTVSYPKGPVENFRPHLEESVGSLTSVHSNSKGYIGIQGKTMPESLSNSAIHNLEQVRGHLHSMLNMTKEALPDKEIFDQTGEEGQDLLANLVDVKQDESFTSTGSFPMLSGKTLTSVENFLGINEGIMHSATNVEPSSLGNSALLSEIQIYKEQLQRETFRRKLCEKQITELQSKMLELQQQLAVAVSTDRKKETMIEHLDKALAKVVEGWKRKDAEKVQIIQKLEAENNKLQENFSQQCKEFDSCKAELEDAKERLRFEEDRANQAEERTHMLIDQQAKEREESKATLENEISRRSAAELERNEVHDAKQKLLVNLNNLQQTFDSEQASWEEKERDYLQKIDEITENHLKCMDQEKIRIEKNEEMSSDTQQVLAATQAEVQNLKIEMDTTTREKESLKVEMGLLEARMENSKRKLESDLKSEFQKEMTEQLEEAHTRQMASEEEIRERHRKQMFELNQRHSAEMEEQLKQYQEDLHRREEKLTNQALSFEEKVTEMKMDMETMKLYVKKLESQRLEMTNKLQSMMQSHCSEALRLLQIGSSSSSSSSQSSTAVKESRSEIPSVSEFRITNASSASMSNLSSEGRRQINESFFQQNNNAISFFDNFGNGMVEKWNAHEDREENDKPSDDITIREADRKSYHTNLGERQVSHHVEGQHFRHRLGDDHQETVATTSQPYATQPSRRTTDTQHTVTNNEELRQQRPVMIERSQQSNDMQFRIPTQPNTQSSSLQENATQPNTRRIMVQMKRSPTFLETLAAEAEAVDNQRFRSLHANDPEEFHEHEGVKPLICDSTIDATGQSGSDSLDLRLSTGTLQEDEQDTSNISKSSENHSVISRNSANGLDFNTYTEKVQAHGERQIELQQYIRMLLDKSPSTPESQQEVPTNTPADYPVQDTDYLHSVNSSTVNSDKSLAIFSPVRGQETQKLAFHKSLVKGAEFANVPESDLNESKGVLSPQQVGEISRLLGLYRPGPEGSSNIPSAGTTPPMTDLLTYLKDLKPEADSMNVSQNGSQEAPVRDVVKSPNSKRHLNSTSTAPKQGKVTKSNLSITKGSPPSNKQFHKSHGSKPTTSGTSNSLATKSSVASSSKTATATRKPERKVVSTKAKHGVWK